MSQRILYFHPNNDFTGSTQVLATMLEMCPGPIAVLTCNFSDGCLSRLKNVHIISEYRLKWNGKPIPILSSLVNKVCLFVMTVYYGRKFDAFYINTLKPYHAAIVGSLLRKKIYWHVHEKFLENILATRFYEYVFNHTKADRIFVSDYLKNQYLERKDCTSVVKYNKLSSSFLQKIVITPPEERKLDTVSLICSYNKMKGIYTFRDVAKNLPSINFILILSTSDDEVELFKKEGVPANLIVYSKQADIHPFLRKTDLILNLSNPNYCIETFGMTILEAMAYGIPAIVPNVGGPLEIVDNGVNGYCIDVTDINMVKEKILYSLDKNNYIKLCQGAINKSKQFL